MGFYGPKQKCLASWEAFEKTAVFSDSQCANMCTETRTAGTSLQPVCLGFQLEHIQNYFNMNSYCYLFDSRSNETSSHCPFGMRAFEYGCGETNGDVQFVGDGWFESGCECVCGQDFQKHCLCPTPSSSLYSTIPPSQANGDTLPFGLKYDDLYDLRVAIGLSTFLFLCVLGLLEFCTRRCCCKKQRRENQDYREPLALDDKWGWDSDNDEIVYNSEDGSHSQRPLSPASHASYPSEPGPPFFHNASPSVGRAFSIPSYVGDPPLVPPKPLDSISIPEIQPKHEDTPDDYTDADSLDGWASNLQLVADLYKKGLLTKEEFKLAKEKLLRQ